MLPPTDIFFAADPDEKLFFFFKVG